jgi:hypothetical protein
MGRMYFTSENCEKTQVLPVIAVRIMNEFSNDDMVVTEVIKVTLPNSTGREGTVVSNYANQKGWATVTKRGRKSILTR